MPTTLTESTVEDAALELFASLGYTVLHGPDIAPGELFGERNSYDEVVLVKRLREAAGRGEKLGFTDEELAFYDALEVNDTAVKVLGDETLRTIARAL